MYDDNNRPVDCVYYDYELKALHKAFDSLYKIFKRIEKRADRRQTVQISKSLFDYYDRKSDLKVVPQKYFDFRYGEYRICLFRYRNKVSVLTVGFSWPECPSRVIDYSGVGNLYGEFDVVNIDCLNMFQSCVYWFVLHFMADCAADDDIPF